MEVTHAQRIARAVTDLGSIADNLSRLTAEMPPTDETKRAVEKFHDELAAVVGRVKLLDRKAVEVLHEHWTHWKKSASSY